MFSYVLEALPPSRLGRRWRYELWEGQRLLRAGWRLSPRRAEQALHLAASHRAHELSGRRAPVTAPLAPAWHPGTSITVEAAGARWRLEPRWEALLVRGAA